jgi:Tol biopolymer transport system component
MQMVNRLMSPKVALISCLVGIAVGCSDGAAGPRTDSFEFAFARSDTGGVSDIYVSRADGSHAMRLTTNAYASGARWSPDASKIAFVTNTYSTLVELMDADGSGRHTLASGSAPAWSPDGSRIGFTGYITVLYPYGGGKSTKINQVFTINPDASNLTPLATDSSYSDMGSWSPDGKKIVFSRWVPGTANEQIYMMDADGSNPTMLTETGADNTNPVWSPTAAKIVFVSRRDGKAAIYTMNPDGTGQTAVTNAAADDICPAWSPDGSRIAFTSNRDGFFQIYVMNADGTSQARIKTNFHDSCPSWKAP